MKRGGLCAKTAGRVLGVMFVIAAPANTPPPSIGEAPSEWTPSWRAASKPSDGLAMGKLTVKFEQTPLSEVLGAVKSGFIQHQGDAAESVYWLCYTALTDSYNARIWIEASGEMGGPDHQVTNIAVQRITNSRPLSDCPTLPKQFQSLSFNNGVWLGAPEAAVEKVFPAGLLHRGERAFIGYQGREPGDGSCDGGYALLNSLYLTFQAGVVVAIDAGQVTSC
jgi:hypothetical protein